jgi:hypothetical protein
VNPVAQVRVPFVKLVEAVMGTKTESKLVFELTAIARKADDLHEEIAKEAKTLAYRAADYAEQVVIEGGFEPVTLTSYVRRLEQNCARYNELRETLRAIFPVVTGKTIAKAYEVWIQTPPPAAEVQS